MNAIPPIAPLPMNQRNIDTDHLNLLSIFHFVGAGLAFLACLLLMVDFAVMHTVLDDPSVWQGQKHPPPPEFFKMFHIFIWFYLVLAIWIIASAILNILSGIFLRMRIYRTFSFVVAGLNCLHIPLGTVLGVFTMIVLIRESVRELYEARAQGLAAR